MVRFETFEESMGVSRNNLRVIKSAVSTAVKDKLRIVATVDGYKVVPVED